VGQLGRSSPPRPRGCATYIPQSTRISYTYIRGISPTTTTAIPGVDGGTVGLGPGRAAGSCFSPPGIVRSPAWPGVWTGLGVA
jgi:hypothetical protein